MGDSRSEVTTGVGTGAGSPSFVRSVPSVAGSSMAAACAGSVAVASGCAMSPAITYSPSNRSSDESAGGHVCCAPGMYVSFSTKMSTPTTMVISRVISAARSSLRRSGVRADMLAVSLI